MTPTHRRIWIVAAAVPLLTVVGCGGATRADSAPPTVERSDWGDSLEQRCDSVAEDFGGLESTAPSTGAEAVRYAERVDEFAAAMVAVFDRAGVPSRDRVDAASLEARFEDLAGATSDLAEASETGDQDRASSSIEEIRRLGEEINADAEGLGVPACGGF